MDALLIAATTGGAAALVAFVVFLAKRQAAARRDALEAVAQQSGWSFSGDRVSLETLGMEESFRLFSQGTSHRATNLMRMSRSGDEVLIFDHQHTVGSGKNRSTHRQTVVHIRSPRLALPPFVLSPEHLLHKLGGLLGYHDIDFPESPEFSSTYLLRSKEAEDRARLLFHPAVRLFFEQRPPLTVEGRNDELLIYKRQRRVKADDLREFVEDAQAIARQLQP
jgi:hypothetical protein